MKYCEFCGKEFRNSATLYDVILPVKDNSGDLPIVSFSICPHCKYRLGECIYYERSKVEEWGTPEGNEQLLHRKPTSNSDRKLTLSIIKDNKKKERWGYSLRIGNNRYTILRSYYIRKDYVIGKCNIILVNSYIKQSRQNYYWQRMIFDLIKELHKRNNVLDYDKLISDYLYLRSI